MIQYTSYFRVYDFEHGILHYIESIFYNLQFDDYIYFVFGFVFAELLKSNKIKNPSKVLLISLIVSVVFLIGRVMLFYTDLSVSDEHSWYYLLINIPLLVVILMLVGNKYVEKLNLKWLCWLGRNSLAVYLWHVLGKLMVQGICDYFNFENNTLYYMLNIVLFCCVLIPAICVMKRSFVCRKLFLGEM